MSPPSSVFHKAPSRLNHAVQVKTFPFPIDLIIHDFTGITFIILMIINQITTKIFFPSYIGIGFGGWLARLFIIVQTCISACTEFFYERIAVCGELYSVFPQEFRIYGPLEMEQVTHFAGLFRNNVGIVFEEHFDDRGQCL